MSVCHDPFVHDHSRASTTERPLYYFESTNAMSATPFANASVFAVG